MWSFQVFQSRWTSSSVNVPPPVHLWLLKASWTVWLVMTWIWLSLYNPTLWWCAASFFWMPINICSCIWQPKPTTAAAQEELKMQFQKKKEELFDVLVELSRTHTYPNLSWEALQVNQLATRLVGKVEPRPGDYYWYSVSQTFGLSFSFVLFILLPSFQITRRLN